MPTEDGEEGETMDATNDDDAAMMAMMGLTGFGSTKVCISYQILTVSCSMLCRANMSTATKRAELTSRKCAPGVNT